MSDGKKPIGLMVRLPVDLHAAVSEWAKGTPTRPETSLNTAVVFLLRAGLASLERAEKSENESGQLAALVETW